VFRSEGANDRRREYGRGLSPTPSRLAFHGMRERLFLLVVSRCDPLACGRVTEPKGEEGSRQCQLLESGPGALYFLFVCVCVCFARPAEPFLVRQAERVKRGKTKRYPAHTSHHCCGSLFTPRFPSSPPHVLILRPCRPPLLPLRPLLAVPRRLWGYRGGERSRGQEYRSGGS
jgi:hypothetical protein